MRKIDVDYISAKQKKLFCTEKNCGENFTFTVAQKELDHLSREEIVYRGRCNKCLTTIRVKNLGTFARLMGSPKLIVTQSTFDTLFE